jgi:hypothetical protein
MTAPLGTPVVFFAYNRPSHTAQTFKRIAEAKPETLFVILDGPKDNVSGDVEKCAAVQDVVSQVDWACTVRCTSAPRNMGIRKRIQSGLDWVFQQVDRAIVVEDDCLLDPTFFRFADELLAYYEQDERVGVICSQGDELPSADASYHASRYPLVWGWATWRRTWKLYEPNIESWPAIMESGLLLDRLKDPLAAAYWRGQINRVYEGFDTWDYMFNYCCWRFDLLAIHPSVNMLSNIGFGAEATNTTRRHTPFGCTAQAMQFPLRHPANLDVSPAREARLFAAHYGMTSKEALKRVRGRVSSGLTGNAE